MATYGRNMYFATNGIKSNDSKYASINDCLGVDYFHKRESVPTSRATDLRNLIHINGHNEKRNGYQQMFNSFTDANQVGKNINGIWEIKTSQNGIINSFIVIQVEKDFYWKLKDSNTSFSLITITFGTHSQNDIRNEKSFGIVRGNRLYILCGLYLVFYVTYSGTTPTGHIKLVEDADDTYVPTTTIGIGSNENGLNELIKRVSLDEPNLMTQRRINQLVCDKNLFSVSGFDVDPSVYVSATQIFSTRVGKRIDKYRYNDAYNNGLQLNIDVGRKIFKFSITKDACATGYTYNNPTGNDTLFNEFKSWLKNTNNTNLMSLETEDDIDIMAYRLGYFQVTCSNNVVSFYLCTDQLISISINSIAFQNTTTQLSFTLDTNLDTNKQVKLNGTALTINAHYTCTNNNFVLLASAFAYLNESIDGNATNELMFYSSESSRADLINKCRFGCLYQYNELGQLFVSGNPDYPNYDWHSSDRYYNETQDLSNLSEYEDLTYFGSESYYMLGGASTKITGYNLLSDSTLGVHKEYNPNECNMYLRKPTTTTITLADGETTMYKLDYTQHPTSIKEGAISFDTIGDLYNDNLFLSQNGLYAIQLTENVLSDVRIAVERSTIVNNKLTKEDFTNATSIVFDNRYYLSLNDEEGKVYVADARFRNKVSDEIPDTLSYEFWIWDNVPARVWSVIDGELWFGTNDGRICKFVDSYEDTTFNTYAASLVMNERETPILDSLTSFSFTGNFTNLKVGDNIEFISDVSRYLYIKELDTTTTIDSSHRLYISNEDFNKTFESIVIPSDNPSEQKYKNIRVNVNIAGVTNNYDLIFGTDGGIYFKTTEGAAVSLNASTFILIGLADKQTQKILSLSADALTFESEYIIINDGVEVIQPRFFIYSSGSKFFNKIIKKPIKSYWITPSMNFGLPNYLKKVFNLTLVPSVFINSEIKISFQTLSQYGLLNNAMNQNVEGDNYLDFSNLDFNSFTFRTNEFSVSYNRHKIIQDFNYIQFVLQSDASTNFSFSEFDIEYKIVKKAKGVK